ncbi:hypothetical protein M9H77_34657 [Catharanthus roseus]|uniref:Uncharacterized protein n=1 Tax=Catharanthus roseus TaxID=4058 RepID=A0ACB9ZLS4_CATRO|nr:hypothetical protein M9H77_34657 [Catharanthus roseus]
MEIQDRDGKMEGWLHLIRFNRFGLQYSRKRYFILEDNCLKSFKSIPTSVAEEPVRIAIIDSCIRVIDNGRESHHRRVFFIFTLYNTSDHNDQLKFGASSSEEAAKWICCLKYAAMNPVMDSRDSSERKWKPFRLSVSKRTAQKSISDKSSALSMHVNAMTSDVIAPSPWKIFGCQNGLRLFKEAKEHHPDGRVWDKNPAIMAVGVVDGSSEAIFRILMSLGPSRSEWDFCFHRGSVVEHLDGHTDIIHAQLYRHWLPWGMKRRDLLVRRYWRREDDGTYVILYHSVVHNKCPPQQGYVRACLKSGGYVITPINKGKESIVKHMLAVDWKFWRSHLRKATTRSSTIHLLGRVAALRELFRAKGGKYSSEFISGEITRDISLPQGLKEDIKVAVDAKRNQENDELDRPVSGSSSLVGLNDAVDEFFDVPEPSDDDHSEHGWLNTSPQMHYLETYPPKLSSAANFVKKLHDLAVQKKGYVDLQEIAWEDNVLNCYGATLPKDPSHNMPCSWAPGDPSSFLIRGSNYLEDHQKIKAKSSLMQMVGADWIRSDKREDDLAGRPGSIVQKYASQGGNEFFFVINIQVPGTTTYNLALYYMMETPLEEAPLLEKFVNGDDAFRNSRFKLIPYISKGSWIVKQSVGKKACLVGQQLDVNYYRGTNYLELCVDVGSSTVARGVVSLVLGYLNNLVIEMAFVLQANTAEELPEFLLGTCRLNHLDADKSVATDSISC